MASQHADAHVMGMPLAEQVDDGVADREVLDSEPRQPVRQHGIDEADLAMHGVNLQSKHSLQQHEHAAGGPRLRQARDRVQRRAFSGTPPEPA